VFKGRMIEFVRRHSTGLWVSQNFIQNHETFYQGFAVLLTPRDLGPHLYSPAPSLKHLTTQILIEGLEISAPNEIQLCSSGKHCLVGACAFLGELVHVGHQNNTV
jgi:hypothetical protein